MSVTIQLQSLDAILHLTDRARISHCWQKCWQSVSETCCVLFSVYRRDNYLRTCLIL